MPKIKIFLSVKYFWYCLIDLLKRFVFSIKWSDVKKIKGWLSGISFINTELSIAGAVFLFAGSRIILYLLKPFNLKCFLISLTYFLLVLIIG